MLYLMKINNMDNCLKYKSLNTLIFHVFLNIGHKYTKGITGCQEKN